MSIQGLVFDCDGTLADTMPFHWRAWQVIAERHGFEFSEKRFYQLGGVPSRDILRMLNAEQNLTMDPISVAKEKEDAYLPFLSEVRPVDHIVAIAKEQHGNVPMAVATGGTRRVITQVLARLGIFELFSDVVTSEDVVNQKPAPDIFLEAARRIDVPPGACRAYEDTDLGIQAIRAAGMEAVDVREFCEPNKS